MIYFDPAATTKPSPASMEAAMRVLTLCVKLAAVEKLLG